MHSRAAYQLFVTFAVWCESHSAVEENFQVGPYFVEVCLACYFKHAVDYRQHPRRHAAYVAYVLAGCFVCYAVALGFEIGQQSGLFARHAQQVHNRVDVFYEYCAQVANQAVGQVVVWRVAAAEYERASVEYAAVGVVAQVERHGVAPAGVVHPLQPFAAYGYELALVVGCSRRFGIPPHTSGPQYVGFAAAHAVDVSFRLFVCVYGYGAGKVLIAFHVGVAVFLAPFGVAGAFEQTF